MTEPDITIKQRPDPQKTYRIEMTIENAPGPFAVVEGVAHYSVSNHFECGHIDPVPGVASRITTSPPIVWTPLGDGRYETTVHEDLLVDEDYYGRGVCHWEFVEAGAILKATGTAGETRFLPSISAEKIAAQKTMTLYFPAERYPTSEMADFGDHGHSSLEKYKPEFRDTLFSITLFAKGVEP